MRQYGYAIARRVRIDGRQKADGYDAVLRKKRIFVPPNPKFKNLTFPLIIPFFTINMVLCMKNFLMVFDQIMALTKGGPAQSTESISFLIYKNGMDGGQFGFQSANAVLFFVVIVAISIFQLTFMNKKEEQL